MSINIRVVSIKTLCFERLEKDEVTKNPQKTVINYVWAKQFFKKKGRGDGEFPGGPVVRTQHFHCCDLASIPGPGTKVLHSDPASHVVQPQKKKIILKERKHFNL